MKLLIKIIAIILMAGYSYLHGYEKVILWELIVDFGNDMTFIMEVTPDKNKCQKRAEEIIQKEGVIAYCIKRGN